MDDAFEGMVEESKYDIKVIKDYIDHSLETSVHKNGKTMYLLDRN